MGPHDHGSPISEPGSLRSVAGAGLTLTLVGPLGAGIGWIVRSTAGAITALVELLLILPNLVPLVGNWSNSIAKYMPTNAGESFITSTRMTNTLAPVTGIAVLALWVAAAFAAAAVLVRHRDADRPRALCPDTTTSAMTAKLDHHRCLRSGLYVAGGARSDRWSPAFAGLAAVVGVRAWVAGLVSAGGLCVVGFGPRGGA